VASHSVARTASLVPVVLALELLISEAMDEWKISGLAVAVVQDGGVAFAMSKPT
jgi:hypothetical protein